MRNFAFRAVLILLAGAGGAPVYAAPAIGTTTASPGTINAGRPTTVTVTSVITDPSLITTGINLLRLNPGGSPLILGQLHDDGLNGDAVAGDKTFTVQMSFNEPAAGQFQLQVSAAFKGVLQRVLSTTMTVMVTTGSPPTITASASPAPNAAGWNNSDVTVTFACSDTASGIRSCPSPVTVTTSGGNQLVSGTAVNNAGISASASVSVNLDKVLPIITVAAPSAGATLFNPQTTVSGTAADLTSAISSITCNGAAAQVKAVDFSCSLTLVTGANTITIRAVDNAGNVATATVRATVVGAPQVSFTSPANLSFGNLTPITVRGTVDDPAAAVTVNGIAAPVAGGVFTATIPLNEGSNILTAVARNAGGNTGAANISVMLDTTPPHVTIDAPSNNSTTTDVAIAVTGTVNDVVIGTVNSQDAQVTVNGLPAMVGNRTYSAGNVPLGLGANTISVTGRDRVGNASTSSITVTRLASGQPPQPAVGQPVINQFLSIVSGNNQTGTILTALPAPLVVALRDSSNNPVRNQPVIFRVTGDNGSVNGLPAISINTDPNGQAIVPWTLGRRSGAGINTVQASTALAVAPVNFAATALPAAASQIVADTGNDQTGVAGQDLPFPLSVVVVDGGNNRVANVPVTFQVTAGGGKIGGFPALTVNTDSDGRALAVLTLGPQAGNNNHVVEATFPGNTGLPAAFSASAKIRGNPAATTVTGVVLDNGGNPLPGVTMRLFLTNQGNLNNLPQQIGNPAITNAQGQFTMPLSASGFFKLMADGSTAPGGSYPTLEYDIVPVAGQSNNVGTPIYLPALDTVSKLCVDQTHGGTLSLPQSPGFSLTVLPGSATFSGGARQGCITVTPVHGDKVPMAPGFGQQPRFIVTIQPVGTTFNPPAAVTYPNTDGLPPKTITELYSYDHDLSAFVSIGAGTVSDDGSVVASNPGVGVLKAGWHATGDPTKKATVAHCPDVCTIAQGSKCVVDPKFSDPNTPPRACENQVSQYNLNIGTGKLSVKILPSCFGACGPNGCGPSKLGFNVTDIVNAIQGSFDAIFNADSTACVGPDLRQQMQTTALNYFSQHKGLIIGCEDDPVDQTGKKDAVCAYEDPSKPLNTEIDLRPSAFGKRADVNLECFGLGATVLHELVHLLASDKGAPGHNTVQKVSDVSPTDRPFGCMASCWGAPVGNPDACK